MSKSLPTVFLSFLLAGFIASAARAEPVAGESGKAIAAAFSPSWTAMPLPAW